MRGNGPLTLTYWMYVGHNHAPRTGSRGIEGQRSRLELALRVSVRNAVRQDLYPPSRRVF